MICEICNGESGGTVVGVASVPGAPVSICWCSECLKRDCAPRWVFDHDYVFVAGGEVDRLVDWARKRWTWVDGNYVQFDDYVKRWTPEMVQEELRKFGKAVHEDQRDV